MTPNEAREAIYQRFVAQWGDQTPVAFDNQAYDAPEDAVAWVRIVVRNGLSLQHTLAPSGSRVFRRQAHVAVQVFVPVDTGTAIADALAHQARMIFEGHRDTELEFGDTVYREGGADGRWYMMIVTTAFTYDETR